MKAMLLQEITSFEHNPNPLSLVDMPVPKISEGELLLRVITCGVCHTELDEIEGRTPPPNLPIVPGHQVVGVVERIAGSRAVSNRSEPFKVGQRVGVAWIYSACGHCQFCSSGRENLCPDFRATGRDANGGYAEFITVPSAYVNSIPALLSDSEAAPLLCAGAVGYRALKLTGLEDGENLGLTGFGASNHLVLKMTRYKYPNTGIYVFSRNPQECEFARSLGAIWAGGIDETPPEKLDAVLDATPVWKPITLALKYLNPGGRLVINAIRKEEIDKEVLLALDYPSQLWLEKEIKSVANVTRQDVREFLSLAVEAGIRPEFQEYKLEDANQALIELKQGKIRGAKVLRINK